MSIETLLRERAVLKDVRRVVVKVGTHAIAKKSGRPDYVALRRIVSGICALRSAGREPYLHFGAIVKVQGIAVHHSFAGAGDGSCQQRTAEQEIE